MGGVEIVGFGYLISFLNCQFVISYLIHRQLILLYGILYVHVCMQGLIQDFLLGGGKSNSDLIVVYLCIDQLITSNKQLCSF